MSAEPQIEANEPLPAPAENPAQGQESEPKDRFALAKSAVESALPFVDLMIQRFTSICADLRNGNDAEALGRLGSSAEDLEDFLTYTILIAEFIVEEAGPLCDQLAASRKRLMSAVDTLNPALSDLDLVEVADTIEQDIIAALSEYRDIHPTVASSLGTP